MSHRSLKRSSPGLHLVTDITFCCYCWRFWRHCSTILVLHRYSLWFLLFGSLERKWKQDHYEMNFHWNWPIICLLRNWVFSQFEWNFQYKRHMLSCVKALHNSCIFGMYFTFSTLESIVVYALLSGWRFAIQFKE